MGRFFDFVVFCLFLFLFLGVSTWYHERVHQQIFSDFGVNSSVVYHWWGAETVPDNVILSDDDYRSLMDSQHLVEAFSYNLVGVEFLLILVFAVVFFWWRDWCGG